LTPRKIADKRNGIDNKAMAARSVILCTGANRGLGFEILHVAALREPSSVYVLASRELAAGHEALQELRKLGVESDIEVVQLDVTNDEQIAAAAEFVKVKYGKLDGWCPWRVEKYHLPSTVS
jgi:NAD(P)-dependent dehydrogenase (short-subunit alcohol dehydrogenase family)